MGELELREQKRMTKAFIDANPVVLTLAYQPTEDDGAGGRRRTSPQARPAQTFGLATKAQDPSRYEDQVGDRKVTYYVLVGEAGALIAPGDTFTYGGNDYTVIEVHDEQPYEVIADVEVVSRG